MCGIAGLLGHHGPDLGQTVARMAEAVRYRGPDDSGVWCDSGQGLALGHARLSILDLSPEGHQPMVSASGRYVISYNGEAYNFLELRSELESKGAKFHGRSDTEVMLAAFEQWGLEPAVRRFVGMFAFALWDRDERTLYLVRDRIGIKPLYFGWAGTAFLFASELKALRSHPDFDPEVNRDALALYLRHNYVPAPFSIYRNFYKLLPGCILSVTPAHVDQRSEFSPNPDDQRAAWKPIRYWSASTVVEQGCADPFEGSETEATQYLDTLLRDAVRLRMISDVPLGAFLSGGIDSSTVVALMQAQSVRPVKTFTIGFKEMGFDEAPHAKAVAQHLETDHTELYVTPQEAMTVIPYLPDLYDEPFSDSSQIPVFLISQLARKDVTVVLSGDGGDELFGGYTRYATCQTIWQRLGWLPLPLRNLMASSIRLLSPSQWTLLFRAADPFLPGRFKMWLPGDKLYKLAEVLTTPSPEHMYYLLISHWRQPEEVVVRAQQPVDVTFDGFRVPALTGLTARMMYWDLITYLPDDILTKVDRASMGLGLEARVPILDHRVVEFSWRLPLSLKIREDQSKWLLRQVLYKYVPMALVERPKMGFGVPIDSWLRGPLRDWAEHLLEESRLRKEGFFNPEPIRRKWAQHLSGDCDWQYLLWDVLMFQAWKDRWC